MSERAMVNLHTCQSDGIETYDILWLDTMNSTIFRARNSTLNSAPHSQNTILDSTLAQHR